MRPSRSRKSDPLDAFFRPGYSQVLETPVSATEHRIDATLGGTIQDRRVWAARPEFRKVVTRHLLESDSQPPTRTVRFAPRGLLSSLTGAGQRLPSISYGVVEGALRVWSTDNERLAVGAPRHSYPIAVQGRARTPRLERDSRDAVAQLEEMFPGIGLHAGALLNQTMQLEPLLVELLRSTRPRCIVIGTTESPWARLIVWHAREMGLASVYAAHAPLPAARSYGDVPTDFALLFGEGEREYYADIGSQSERAIVSGSRIASQAPNFGRRNTVVLAGTLHHDREELEHRLPLLRDLITDYRLQFVVAPHPREKGGLPVLAERFGIDVHRGRSANLVASGDVAGIIGERESGLLLEGEYVGARGAFLGGVSTYLFVEDLGIPRIDGTEELAVWLEGLARSVPTSRDRVRHWMLTVGGDAADIAEEHIRNIDGAASPFLDSWKQF